MAALRKDVSVEENLTRFASLTIVSCVEKCHYRFHWITDASKSANFVVTFSMVALFERDNSIGMKADFVRRARF